MTQNRFMTAARGLSKGRFPAALLAVPLLAGLTACGGGSSSKAPSSVTVSCDGSTILVGAARIEIAANPKDGTSILTYPDPVDSAKTGTMTIKRGQHCTVAPTRDINS